jgi:hypothetical protein
MKTALIFASAEKCHTNSGCRLRTLLLCLLPSWLAVSAFGQGTVVLNNRVSGVVTSHVYDSSLCFSGNGSDDFPAGPVDWTGLTRVSGAGYLAALLAGPGADQPEESLRAGSPPTTFRTGLAAGTVAGTTVTLANVAVDAPVATIQMVAWDNSSGLYSDWASAYGAYYAGLIELSRSP